MKRMLKWIPMFLLTALCGVVEASNVPHIQYAFPAGGQQDTSFEVQVGGQYLQGATNVFVNGGGVRIEVLNFGIKYEPRRLRQLWRNKENRKASLEGKEGKERERILNQIRQIEKQLALAEVPEGVDPMNKKAMQRYYKFNSKEQFNPQIQDRLRLKVTIDKDAAPGERELRVYTPSGLSNPLTFIVGALAEETEQEPNDDHMRPELQEIPVPSIINGQIRPGDIDHFRFKANKGDSIVLDVAARRIIPYLADAVPGWFQAIVSIYDEDGDEVAYQDDYRFNPDPVLFFDVPKPGTYTVSIRDSIYRGREDFIYRIAVGELPFITGIFPLGAEQGKDVDIALSGRNLPKNRLTGKLPKAGYEVRHVSVAKDGYRSNQMPFAIGELPDLFETEPNNATGQAQRVTIPTIVNGRIEQVGDRDVFAFQAKKGDTVSVEVTARRLNSPLDSVLTLTGPGLDEPVRNDDYVNKDATHLYLGAGLVTHHADSYLTHQLPASGIYFLEVDDAQSKGGHDYAYRLRISPANPDFNLRMEPSGIQIAPGGTAAFTIRALKHDGFDGRIKLDVENLPEGFAMSKAIIPKGSDMTRFTITAPPKIEGKLVSPQVNGSAEINGRVITRPAVPVDDQMQAFLYRHLVPARELVLAPVSARPPLSFEAQVPKSGILELPLGEKIRVNVNGRIRSGRKGFAIKLDHPPDGLVSDKGWIGRKKLKGKNKKGEPKFEKSLAAGGIFLTAEEPLKPGDRMSLVLAAEMKQGRDTIYYPAPAIPIRIVKPRAE